MDWVQMAPSAPWQWLGLLAGLAGLGLAIMALPTVFQMFGGRPAPDIHFSAVTLGNDAGLQCHIKNRRVKRWLSRLGVTRQSTMVTVDITVREFGSGKLVHEHAMLKMTNGADKGSASVAQLTSTWPLVVAPFIYTRETAVLCHNLGREVIEPGVYAVVVTVSHEHGRHTFRKRVNVGRSVDELYWKD